MRISSSLASFSLSLSLSRSLVQSVTESPSVFLGCFYFSSFPCTRRGECVCDLWVRNFDLRLREKLWVSGCVVSHSPFSSSSFFMWNRWRANCKGKREKTALTSESKNSHTIKRTTALEQLQSTWRYFCVCVYVHVDVCLWMRMRMRMWVSVFHSLFPSDEDDDDDVKKREHIRVRKA